MVIPHKVVLFLYTSSSPPFVLRDSRGSETRARVKITPREKGETRWGAACRLFSRGVIFTRSRFAPSTIREDKWRTSRSLSFWKFWKTFFVSLLEVVKNSNPTFWLNRKRPIFRFFFFKKKNVLDRCNEASYMIPFVMNERSVDCVIKAT